MDHVHPFAPIGLMRKQILPNCKIYRVIGIMGSFRTKVGASSHGWMADHGLWLVALALLLWISQAAFMPERVDTWLDEGMYLVKSSNYAFGRIEPCSLDDPTSYPPVYFSVARHRATNFWRAAICLISGDA
jgi:hypothetical protein